MDVANKKVKIYFHIKMIHCFLMIEKIANFSPLQINIYLLRFSGKCIILFYCTWKTMQRFNIVMTFTKNKTTLRTTQVICKKLYLMYVCYSFPLFLYQRVNRSRSSLLSTVALFKRVIRVICSRHLF